MKGRRYKLWWPGKGDGVGGVGAMVAELCKKVLEVRRVSDSDDCCCCFSRGCAEVELWVCAAKWKNWKKNSILRSVEMRVGYAFCI